MAQYYVNKKGETMPNPLQPPWANLIPLIPVAEHSVSVAAHLWEPHFAQHGLQNHFQAIFGNNQAFRLSRGRLQNHAYPALQQKCLEILMWGYPTGAQGNLIAAFLQNVNEIAEVAPQNLQWPDYYNQLHNIGNLGISTITKLAYFYAHQFDELPALILDQKVIRVLNEGRWVGLAIPGINYGNAPGEYLEYLQRASDIADQLEECTTDQIELLLFLCGEAF